MNTVGVPNTQSSEGNTAESSTGGRSGGRGDVEMMEEDGDTVEDGAEDENGPGDSDDEGEGDEDEDEEDEDEEEEEEEDDDDEEGDDKSEDLEGGDGDVSTWTFLSDFSHCPFRMISKSPAHDQLKVTKSAERPKQNQGQKEMSLKGKQRMEKLRNQRRKHEDELVQKMICPHPHHR